MKVDSKFSALIDYLEKIPAVLTPVASEMDKDGIWWVKFQIDIDHDLAWHVIQELGCVIDNLSIGERLPAVFYPVSPPPYLNGGPKEYLSWVIETKDKEFLPETLMKWLEGRLPNPVDDLDQWSDEEE